MRRVTIDSNLGSCDYVVAGYGKGATIIEASFRNSKSTNSPRLGHCLNRNPSTSNLINSLHSSRGVFATKQIPVSGQTWSIS